MPYGGLSIIKFTPYIISKPWEIGPALSHVIGELKSRTKETRPVPAYVIMGGHKVAVRGMWTKAGQVSAIQTLDDQNMAPNLQTLASRTRAAEVLAMLSAPDAAHQDRRAAAILAVEIAISEQQYGGRGAIICALLALSADDYCSKKLGLKSRYHKLYIGTDGRKPGQHLDYMQEAHGRMLQFGTAPSLTAL